MGEPRERPILFSAPMVRAILDGRKTQTRRVAKARVKLEPGNEWAPCLCGEIDVSDQPCLRCEAIAGLCPHGSPGDRLWVRESLRWSDEYARWEYAADGMALQSPPAKWSERCAWTERVGDRRHAPSIHMPRWASRLTLRVTSACVERVQDISDADARAEGLIPMSDGYSLSPFEDGVCGAGPSMAFAYLWDSINGKRAGCAWRDNPWVWAVGFEVERRA